MLVFLDANIFFASAGCPNGGSALVLTLAEKKVFETVTIKYTLAESERNIRKKLGEAALARYQETLAKVQPALQELEGIPLLLAKNMELLMPAKGVPILLGTIASKSDFLITLDRKDFLANPKLKTAAIPFEMGTPGDFLKRYFQENTGNGSAL